MSKRDLNQLAKFIVDQVVGNISKPKPKLIKQQLGGQKGGPARAKKLSSLERKNSAMKAAKKRWGR